MRRVFLESPFAGKSPEERARNVAYARECMRDCLRRGESPLAPHLLYPQVVDDDFFDDRMLGINAGLVWASCAEATVVYTDLGISTGMEIGIRAAVESGRVVVERSLFPEEKDPEGRRSAFEAFLRGISQTIGHGG